MATTADTAAAVSDTSLRVAVSDDLDHLFLIHEAAMRLHAERAYGPWDTEHQRRLYASRNPADLVEVVVSSTLGDVGVVRTRVEDDVLTVDLIELLPRAQRQGIGRAVMHLLKERAAARRKPLSLTVHKLNPEAIQFYKAQGFHSVGETSSHMLLLWALPANE